MNPTASPDAEQRAAGICNRRTALTTRIISGPLMQSHPPRRVICIPNFGHFSIR